MSSALSDLLTPTTLLFLAAGTLVGILVGSLPGIGPAVGIGLLLPLTYVIEPAHAIVFYVSLYQAAEYGGSITAISISTPGAPNSAATILDGYPMSRKGSPGLAYGYSLWSAVAASYVTVVAVILLVTPLSKLALAIGAPEITSLGIFALATVAILSASAPMKGVLSCVLGLLLGVVGLDPVTGLERFTFNQPQLADGMPLLPVLVGVFAIPAVIQLLLGRKARVEEAAAQGQTRVWLPMKKFLQVARANGIGTGVGFLLGLIPGLSGSVPPWISYNIVKGTSKERHLFGHGAPEGIAAPESTNAAVMHSTLVPAFALGIPGTPTSAVILGAMTLAGLRPGPSFLTTQRPLFYELFFGLIIATTLLWIAGILVTRLWVRALSIPREVLALAILVLCVVGAYSGRSQLFDVWVMAGAGLLGYVMMSRGYSVPAFILGLIVGPIIETNLRQALLISQGDLSTFLTSPVSCILLVLTLVAVVFGTKLMRKLSGPVGTKPVPAPSPVAEPAQQVRR